MGSTSSSLKRPNNPLTNSLENSKNLKRTIRNQRLLFGRNTSRMFLRSLGPQKTLMMRYRQSGKIDSSTDRKRTLRSLRRSSRLRRGSSKEPFLRRGSSFHGQKEKD